VSDQQLTTDPRALAFATASWGRRVLALAVDWLFSSLVAALFLGPRAVPVLGALVVDKAGGAANGWVLLVYVVESVVLTATAGGSFGKMATRLRTVRVDGDPRPLDPLRTLARQIMIAVVVPPLIFRADGRGLHDLACGTASVTLETYRSFFRRLAD